jgi:hypothetical protein
MVKRLIVFLTVVVLISGCSGSSSSGVGKDAGIYGGVISTHLIYDRQWFDDSEYFSYRISPDGKITDLVKEPGCTYVGPNFDQYLIFTGSEYCSDAGFGFCTINYRGFMISPSSTSGKGLYVSIGGDFSCTGGSDTNYQPISGRVGGQGYMPKIG